MLKFFFLILSVFFLPLPSYAGWVFIPDAFMNPPKAKVRLFSVNGVKTDVRFAAVPVGTPQPNFFIDPFLALPVVITPAIAAANNILAPNLVTGINNQALTPVSFMMNFDPLIASKMFSFAFLLVSVSAMAGIGVAELIRALNIR